MCDINLLFGVKNMKRLMVFMLLARSSYLNATVYLPAKQKASPLMDIVLFLKDAMDELSFVFGFGMFMMALYKYSEYRDNPFATTFGSVMGLLLAGIALMSIYLIPMAAELPGFPGGK